MLQAFCLIGIRINIQAIIGINYLKLQRICQKEIFIKIN